MHILAVIIPFIVVLGTMVFIHELGHFAVAKFLKIKVETFSIGFGPRLFGFVYGDTDYRVSAIPLGGYVKMKGENLDEEIQGTGDEFLSRSKWERFLVLVAGPAMNIVTAIAIPAFLAMFFFHVPAYLNESAVVGSVALESAAAHAGIQSGDKIIKFASVQNPTWNQVNDFTSINVGQPLPVTVLRNGTELSLTLTPSVRTIGSEKIGESGLLPNDIPNSPLVIQGIQSGQPAQIAGLKPQDVITKLNGQPVIHFQWFASSLQNLENQKISLEVDRAGQKMNIDVTPVRTSGIVRLGFERGPIPPMRMITENKSFFGAFQYSLDENWRIIVLTKEAFAQIFRGDRNVKETLAGPIGIAKISSEAYQGAGIEGILKLMALLSLNLGIFNLLPIPVLDGGHIFIIFLEVLFGLVGWKVTAGFKEKAMQSGFVLLMLLMGFVIYNDIAKTFSDRSAPVSKPSPPSQSK